MTIENTKSFEPWLQVAKNGNLQLTVHVQPGAKSTSCSGIHGDALKIRLAAPPVDGKANQSLIAWLSKTLKVPQQSISLIRGQTSRRKVFILNNANIENLISQLRSLASEN